jgi:hypothetical protein
MLYALLLVIGHFTPDDSFRIFSISIFLVNKPTTDHSVVDGPRRDHMAGAYSCCMKQFGDAQGRISWGYRGFSKLLIGPAILYYSVGGQPLPSKTTAWGLSAYRANILL